MAAETLLIRDAVETDAPVIYSFLCTLEEALLDQTAFRAVFLRNLADPDVYYLVAEREGEVIGFISCHVQYLLHHTGKVGEIQELFVQPNARGQRVGHQLLANLMAQLVLENIVNLEVTTNQKRQDTIRFYERESFNLSHVKLVKLIQP